MSPFKLSRQELGNLFKNRFLRLAILVVTIIPLLYGVLYLWAFWDPYAKLNNLPVAVVNEDTGVISNSENVSFGNDLVANLKSNQVMKWEFVNEKSAQDGLQSKKYFAEVRIPSDFSTKVASASTTNPEQANLIFIAKESNSMIGSQLSNRVASQISDNLSHEITKTYLNNIFIQTRESAENIQKAANGTGQLSEGLTSALSGSNKLSDGTNSAYAGSASLVLGINKILLGDRDLNNGIDQNLKGAQSLSAGISITASSAKDLAIGSKQLEDGVAQVASGTTKLLADVSSSDSNLALVKTYLNDPDTIINDGSSPFNGLTKFQAANAIISGILTEANKPENQQEVATLQAGLTTLSASSQALSQGASGLSDALNNQIGPGSSQLSDGLTKLSAGSKDLDNGLTDALLGSKKLSEGLSSVSYGSKSLDTGISSAQTGAETLGHELSSGAQKALESSNISLTEKLSPIMANPVRLDDSSISKVKNYGTGFSPYFMPLALWVGSLVLFLVIKVNDKKNVFEKKLKPKALFASKFVTLATIGTAQAVILDLVLIFALGLRTTNYFYLFSFSILISWCFLAILQLLVAAFQDAGKFLGIVLLMLQLTSASGTYPVQTSPIFFQTISPYLPMTYAVRGLREIISGGNIHNIMISYLFILMFLTGFLFLIILLSNKLSKSRVNLSV